MLKKILLAALVASSFAAVPVASFAQRTVIIREAPPPPREEAQPQLRRGYVWAPGHWEWRGQRHVWVPGRQIRERRGYHWEADRWVERNGRWELRHGRWARGDRDGDGVPNRVDSHPNNPNRR